MFHALSKKDLSVTLTALAFDPATWQRSTLSFTLTYAVLYIIGVVKERSRVVREDS